MTQPYRIFGSELSPYSVKVRSYFRFKGLAHEWIVRTTANMDEFRKYARLPLIPLVITPDGGGLQDSTPVIERMEALHPSPALQPEDATLAFLSALIEEYGDEWVVKPMFHYRWTYEADQISTSRRVAADHMGADELTLEPVAEKVRERMVPRLSFVGSSPETAPVIEGSFLGLLDILEAHFARHSYLLGPRPSLADFGLFAQLYECSTDPTPGAVMRARVPRVLAWIDRMLEAAPVDEAFASWRELQATLAPLLRDQIGTVFLPWSVANAAAIEAGEDSFSLKLGGAPFSQAPQKYQARSLAAIREKYRAVADRADLDPILEDTGCWRYLA